MLKSYYYVLGLSGGQNIIKIGKSLRDARKILVHNNSDKGNFMQCHFFWGGGNPGIN